MPIEDIAAKMMELRKDEGVKFVGYPANLDDKAYFFEKQIDVEEDFIDLGDSFEKNPIGFIDKLELGTKGKNALFIVLKDMASGKTFHSLESIPATKVAGCIDTEAYTFEQNPASVVLLDDLSL